jgi:hypothetical protein
MNEPPPERLRAVPALVRHMGEHGTVVHVLAGRVG